MDKKPLALRVSTVAVTALVALIGSVALAAVDTAAIDAKVSATLDKFYALNERNKYLADNAAGALVFPSITKADRKSTRLNSSHLKLSLMPSSA